MSPQASAQSSESPRSEPCDVSIILPTYNERENICDLIDAIRLHLASTAWRYEILVVDDDSPDGTASVVRERYGITEGAQVAMPAGADGVQNKEAVRMIVRTRDKGLAFAVREGMERAQGQTLVVMDTDFNHDPAMIPQMVDLLRYYDLLIGSRFVMGGGMEDALRYRLSLFYNVFIRFVFHTQVQDNLSGFFALRQERFHELAPKFDRIFHGYGDYFIRLLVVAWRQDWKILEVPVFYILRRHGTSKTGFWRIFKDYTLAVIRLRFRGI